MRILIDECVDPRIKQLFPEQEVHTVHEMGWDRLTDGEVLGLAQTSFDALITIDRGLEFQQNLKKFSIGVIVVEVLKNQLPYYQAVQAELLSAVRTIEPGKRIHVISHFLG